MTEKDLSEEIAYVEANKDRLLREYFDKYILVHGNELINSFDTYEAAAQEGVRLFGTDDKFLIYQVTEEEPINVVVGADL